MNYKDYFLFGDRFEPTARKGDMYAKFPKALKRFNILSQYEQNFTEITGNKKLKKAILFCNKSMHDSHFHTMDKHFSPDDYAYIVYSQKSLACVFLNTLQYREENKQIDHELCEIMSTFLVTSFVGNKINYIIDFTALDEISKMPTKEAIKNMTAHLNISRASMNWIYADSTPNLADKVAEARQTTLCAVLSRPDFSDGIDQCEIALNQWKFLQNHLFGNKSNPPWKTQKTDQGIYQKSRQDIEHRLESLGTISKTKQAEREF